MHVVPYCNEKDIKPVVSNNSIDQQCAVFCHHYLTLTETQSLHTEQKHQRERNTTSLGPGCCNIFHSRSFYVGFKHAISQFNPIFPAFGALQWNRFHLILNIWSSLPLETPQQCYFFFRKLLKKSLLCPSANHCQLASMNMIIDNQEAGQQIKCQV